MFGFKKKQKQDLTLDALMQEAYGNPEQLGAFYGRLMGGELFILTNDKNAAEGERELPAGTPVNVASFTMEDGTRFIPVFTSMAELQNSIDDEYGVMGLPTRSLFEMVRGVDIIINPAQPYALRLQGEEQQILLNQFGIKKMTVEQDTSVLLGQPAEDPVELKKILADVLRREGSVQAAYMALMMQGQEQSLLVGVLFRPGQDNEKIFETLGAAAGGHMPAGYALDFIVIDKENADGVSEALQRNGDRFFGHG